MEYNYNWEEFPKVIEILDKIYLNTKNEASKIENIDISVEEITSYIADYLIATIGFNYDLNKVISALENLSYISFQEPLLIQNNISMQKLPSFMDFGNRIFLNVNIKNKDMRRFYLYQSLTARVLSFRNNDTHNFSKIYSNEIQSSKKVEASILSDSGWNLLEEALSMEIARKFTSYSTKNNIFIPSESNEYLDILLLFGMTLSNTCTKELHSKEIIIYNLTKQAFNEDFTSKVIREYISENHEFELYQSLFIMGHLLNRKTKRFPNYKASDDEIKTLTIELYQILRDLIKIGSSEYDENIEIKPKKLTMEKKDRLISLINKNI